MQPEYDNGNVRAVCPDCGAATTFEMRSGGNEFGSIVRAAPMKVALLRFDRVVYQLLRCATCGRAGLATVWDKGTVSEGKLAAFYPTTRAIAPLPDGTPEAIVAEVREAETCASAGAWRAASALLRSALEKTLKQNGYSGRLVDCIDEAAEDGVITAARQRRAHDDVRTLGNDILHDDWRPVTEDEYDAAHRYVQRVVEDFYDQRDEVEAVLAAKGRVTP